MVDKEVIRTIVGIIGNVISFFLFASPMPTIRKIWKKKAVEDFSPMPYIATIMNCLLWVFYGLPIVHPKSTLVVTINSVGLALELGYVFIYLLYAPNKKRLKVFGYLLLEVAFLTVVVCVTLLRFHTHDSRSRIVGILCVIFGVCMYMSPLTIMGLVIKTKSVKYMPFLISLANFLNGIVWVIYALLRFDIYILIGNGLGAIGGLAQLILYGIYYRSTPKDEDQHVQKPSEVQLQANVDTGHHTV
ncbi:bidirectional sugar transporter SWEET4-like [Macadamia integrifolia]|uniref:bidirectional sugar transporter SWEET4-like n=1 Tax=Macadamia integrifolia TaxID=60698 RepID=UPI001C4F5226|nr:bidirectional sugar transporter SWEET4-like [Macadamia integrifolia]